MLEGVAKLVNQAAAADPDDCKFDPSGIGGSFQLSPTTITVDATAADRAISFSVSGGRPPYRFSWQGQSPSLENFRFEHGLGDLDIEIKQTTDARTYRFRVGDSAGAAAFGEIVVQGQ